MEDQRKYLTEEELKRFLKVIDAPRDRAIFTVLYWRGLRAAEAGLLKLSDWDRKATRLFVHRGKGSVSGQALLSPAESRALEAWLRIRGSNPGPLFPSREGGGVSRQMIYVLYRQYAKKASLPGELHHPHCLKHSIGTHLCGKMDVQKVQRWIGHKDIRSTLEYAKVRSREMDEAARAIYADSETL